MNNITLINWDSLIELAKMPENSIDSIVTDPPYWISFMNKTWDKWVPWIDIWKECLRVLKPWGHLLAFAWTRTQHRMCCNIEDAWFEIRDMIAWIYGSWFPKSHNIGKSIDKLEWNKRKNIWKEKSWKSSRAFQSLDNTTSWEYNTTKWNSIGEWWGTALKPALEPITVARKPLSEKTVAKNVLKLGTAWINIDECRVWISKEDIEMLNNKSSKNNNWINFDVSIWKNKWTATPPNILWRFPANLIHDWSDEVEEIFPWIYSKSASRFFYCPKTSKKDRDEGLEWFEEKENNIKLWDWFNTATKCKNPNLIKNNHPTVKPTKLMQYLVRLVTPKGWTVLDPFMWSGSTWKAAKLEWFDFIGVDLDENYVKIAYARINNIKIKIKTWNIK